MELGSRSCPFVLQTSTGNKHGVSATRHLEQTRIKLTGEATRIVQLFTLNHSALVRVPVCTAWESDLPSAKDRRKRKKTRVKLVTNLLICDGDTVELATGLSFGRYVRGGSGVHVLECNCCRKCAAGNNHRSCVSHTFGTTSIDRVCHNVFSVSTPETDC